MPAQYKHCGETREFELGDETQSRCRLDINIVLRELAEMKWIIFHPTGGLSTAHSRNPATDKRVYNFDIPVKVRLTTLGELEYIKSKQTQAVYNDNSIKVGGNFTGIAATKSKDSSFINEPNNSEQNRIGKKSLSWTIIGVFVAIAAIIVTIIIYQLQS